MSNDTKTPAYQTASKADRAKNAENIRMSLAKAEKALLEARGHLKNAAFAMEDPELEDQTMHHSDSARNALGGLLLVSGVVTLEKHSWYGFETARKDQH